MENPISILNNICMHNDVTPDYTKLSTEGKTHAPVFTFRVQVKNFSTEASGQSKKKAKHAAASAMLRKLVNVEDFYIENRMELIKQLKEPDCSITPSTDTTNKDGHKNSENLAPSINTIVAGDCNTTSNAELLSNPIGMLQEVCMKKHWHPPIYDEIDGIGLPHERVFKFVCYIENMDLKEFGEGKSKKLAKRAAAEQMLIMLRKQNLDKVDEILDRLPREMKNSSFDIMSDLVRVKNNIDKNHCEENVIRKFLMSLKQDFKKLEQIKKLYSNVENFILQHMCDQLVPDVENMATKLVKIIDCEKVVSIHPEKSNDSKYQCWGEFVTTDNQCQHVTIICTFGTDDDLDVAKHKALSRCLVLFACLFRQIMIDSRKSFMSATNTTTKHNIVTQSIKTL